MPEGIARVAAEENLLDLITLTAEPGVIGGMPASGLDFGAAVNTEALIHQNQLFDFYDGGGLDLACLGMAEVSAAGDVNVSRFESKLAGAGGFINISQNAHKLIFAGTFTTAGHSIEVVDGALRIVAEGRAHKFRHCVQHITFSGPRAVECEQPVLYVTERCVFALTADGLQLIEIAPGIDLERDVLAQMDFAPIVGEVATMDAGIFASSPMGLRALLHDLRLTDRISYDPSRNLLFLNFENTHVGRLDDVRAIQAAVEDRCRQIGRRVDVVVNYERFKLDDDVALVYADMIADLEKRCFGRISCYSTSAFMRRKLGNLFVRSVAPHIFESRRDAQAFLQSVS